MSRYYFNKKEEADGLKRIQTWWLKKNGYLSSGFHYGGIKWTNPWSGKEPSISFTTSIECGDDHVRLYYTQTDAEGNKQDLDYKIPLTTTPCYFGGKRYWFTCPWYANDKYCGRRVGVLYLGGKHFACRHCYNLTYDSRNETRSGSFYPLSYLLTGYSKIHKLESQIKRMSYAGKPTRKQMRLDNIYRRMLPYAITYKQLEKNKQI
jgi:hypothetical protein